MKKTCYLLFLVFLCSCDSIDKLISSTDKEVSEKGKDLVSETNLESLHGVWEGFQDSYYMINKFGDYTIINGERVSIPEAEYKFLFEEGNLLSIRQKVEGDYNDFLEYDYTGTYDLVEANGDVLSLSCQTDYDGYASLNFNIKFDLANDLINVSTLDNSPDFILRRKGKSIKEKLLFIGSGAEAGAIFMDFINTRGKKLQFVYYDDIDKDIINTNNYIIDSSVNEKFCCDFLDDNDQYNQLVNSAVFEIEYFSDLGKNNNSDFIYNIIVKYEEDNTLTVGDFPLDDIYNQEYYEEDPEFEYENIPPPPEIIEIVEDDEEVEETTIESTESYEDLEIEDFEIEEDEEDVEVPFSVVENAPVFPGCEAGNNEKKRKCMSEKIAKFVQRKFNTDLAGDLGLNGRQRISVIFKIDKSGSVTGVRARAPHPRLEAEAKRVINLLPKMQPGKQRGKAVIVPYSLPIIFQVD